MSPAGLRGRGEGGGVLRVDGDKGSPAPGAGSLGMALFLLSLTVLFTGSVVAFLVIRRDAPYWPPPGAPAIPRLLWLSTVLLVSCSAAVQVALSSIRRGDQKRMMHWLAITGGIALLFLACQSVAWAWFFDAATFHRHLYGFTFYMLTGLHAAHVIGGIVGLIVVMIRAWLGHYSWAHYPGVRNVAVYWHFLDAVWLFLFALLIFAG